MKPIVLQNSKEWPVVYSCKFLEAGIVSYEDSDCGIALLKKETIDRMLPTFIGRPVCIDHHQITPENYAELKNSGVIVGNVIKVWFNAEDGWFWADFIVETEKGRACIDEAGYSVSCAYNVLNVQEGGLWHDIKFDGEITDGSFTHLALVEQPRYEDSKITKQFPAMLVNGKVGSYVVENKKTEEIMDFNLKFWEKKENSKEDSARLAGLHVAINGKEVTLAALIAKAESVGLFNEKEDKPMTHLAKEHDIVDIEGHTYPVADIKNALQKMNSAETEEEKKAKELEAKNAKEEEEKKEKELEAKKNEKEEEEKKEKEVKENNKKGKLAFDELNNARGNGEEDGAPMLPLTRAERSQKWHAKNKKQ